VTRPEGQIRLTTCYTLLAFIPLIRFENSRSATNLYFLIILIISWLPFSPISDLLNLLPLVFLVILIILFYPEASCHPDSVDGGLHIRDEWGLFVPPNGHSESRKLVFDLVHVVLRAVVLLDSDLADGHGRDHPPLSHLHDPLGPTARLEELFRL
jgi:hypothetical protein